MTIKISDNIGDAAYVVCILADMPSDFADNVVGVCALCGVAVQHRPYVPDNVPKACIDCFASKLKPHDDVIAVTPTTIVETLRVVYPEAQLRFAPCCIAAFVGHGAATGFAVSKVGTRFPCPDCGRVFELLDQPGGPKWTFVEYGVQ